MKKLKLFKIAVATALTISLLPVNACGNKDLEDSVNEESEDKETNDEDQENDDSENTDNSENSSDTNSDSESNLSDTDASSEGDQEAGSDSSSGDNSVEYCPEFDVFYTNGAGFRFTDGDDGFIYFLADDAYVTDYSRNLISFSDDPCSRIEYDGSKALVTTDSSTYYIDANFSDDGFKELPEDAICANLSQLGFSYVIPTDSSEYGYLYNPKDGSEIGDLYDVYTIHQDEPKLIASNVVANSNCNSSYEEDDNIYWIYSKYSDDKFSLVRAYANADEVKDGDDFTVTEEVIKEGEYLLLYGSRYICYYYSPETLELYCNNKGEESLIYTGDIDTYYVDGTNILLVFGDDLYYYDTTCTEAINFSSDGLKDITCRGGISAYGSFGGHFSTTDITYSIITDNNDNEYVINGTTNDAVDIITLTHKLEEENVSVYPGSSRTDILYIEDGILYIDEVFVNNGSRTYVLYDKEKVLDYYLMPQNTGQERMFIYTEEGNLYDVKYETDEETLVDTGVDLNQDGTGCNGAYDYKWTNFVYSKSGTFYAYDYFSGGVEETFDGASGYIMRNKNFEFDFINGFEDADSGELMYIFGSTPQKVH